MMLSDVCLSVTYIVPKSRTQRPRKTKIGREIADVTRDSDTTFKVKRSKVKVTRPLYSPRRLRIRQLQRWPWERNHRGNLLLRCGQAQSARRREALRRPQREERGGGILWRRPHSFLLLCLFYYYACLCCYKQNFYFCSKPDSQYKKPNPCITVFTTLPEEFIP